MKARDKAGQEGRVVKGMETASASLIAPIPS
jgi:hypothetical protein